MPLRVTVSNALFYNLLLFIRQDRLTLCEPGNTEGKNGGGFEPKNGFICLQPRRSALHPKFINSHQHDTCQHHVPADFVHDIPLRLFHSELFIQICLGNNASEKKDRVRKNSAAKIRCTVPTTSANAELTPSAVVGKRDTTTAKTQARLPVMLSIGP